MTICISVTTFPVTIGERTGFKLLFPEVNKRLFRNHRQIHTLLIVIPGRCALRKNNLCKWSFFLSFYFVHNNMLCNRYKFSQKVIFCVSPFLLKVLVRYMLDSNPVPLPLHLCNRKNNAGRVRIRQLTDLRTQNGCRDHC